MFDFRIARARARRAALVGLTGSLALLSALPGAPIAAAQAAPTLSVGDVTVLEGGLAGAPIQRPRVAVFPVTVSGAHPTLTVDFATRDGLALSGKDYTEKHDTLTIDASEQVGFIRIPIRGDTVFEPDEDFFVDLSNSIFTITDSEGRGLIQNDDQVPSFSVNDATVTENDAGQTVDMVFTVSVSNAASEDMSVDFATANDTARGGLGVAFPPHDFDTKTGTLVFPAEIGQPQQVTVKVRGDDTHEGKETFFLNLSNAVNATIADGQGVGTITDDDNVPTLSIQDVSVAEGTGSNTTANVRATLSNPTTSAVTFTYSTSNGSALAGSDYQDVVNAPVTIPANRTTADLEVTVIGDAILEGNENLFVVIDNAVNANLGSSVAELTIKNDDRIVLPIPPIGR